MQNAGDIAGAMAIYKRLLAKDKKNPDLLIRTALAALNLNDLGQAKTCAQKALKAPPTTGVAHNILGVVAQREKNPIGALKHFEKAVQHMPNDLNARLNLSKLLTEFNRPKDALPHMEYALNLAPDFSKTHYFTGEIHKSLGQMDQAVDSYRNVVRINPNDGDAWKALASIGNTKIGPDTDHLDRAAHDMAAHPLEQAKLLFALFLTFEKAKDYKQAFSYLEAGNDAFTRSIDYDVANDVAHMRNIAATFTPDLFERLQDFGNSSDRPIFIVGMPRSGTTLTEQILAGHSHVSGGGEMTFMEDAIESAGARAGLRYPDTAPQWKKKDIREIAAQYLATSKQMGADTPRLTDKMPENFHFLGAIKLAFPNAKIIHCRRNPVDGCLANYRIMFAEGHRYCYSQDSLVTYYKAYQDLMTHWHDVMGDQILDVDYETLAANPEPEARRILEFCGLEWEDGILEIEKTDRPVFTASAAQVREGIHTRFLSRTDNYAPYIKTLIDAFADA